MDAFLKRIDERLSQLREVPHSLQEKMTLSDLAQLYAYVSKKLREPNMQHLLAEDHRLHLAKEKTGCSHTVNILFNPVAQEYMLSLETKSKELTPTGYQKKDNTQHGGLKTLKPSWRIDTPVPVKFMNGVCYDDKEDEATLAQNANGDSPEYFYTARTDQSLEKVQTEAWYSQYFYEHAVLKEKKHINLLFLGPKITKKGTEKQSIYSQYVEQGDLAQAIQKQAWFLKDNEQKYHILKTLLKAVSVIHAQGCVHQDLKLENILLKRDRMGHYYSVLTDFGSSSFAHSSKDCALATYYVASPEIFALYYEHESPLQKYFHKENTEYQYGCQGYQAFQKNQQVLLEKAFNYLTPHPANDMWAIGVIVATLFPSVPAIEEFKEHLFALEREKRMTIEEALAFVTHHRSRFVGKKRTLDY